MLRLAAPLLILSLAACGQSNEDALQEAANQSDPAAAAVLNKAAEAGVNPQNALEAAGRAQVAAGEQDAAPSGSLQAKPNLPDSPNRPTGGEPPAKISTTETQNATDEHAGHNMQ